MACKIKAELKTYESRTHNVKQRVRCEKPSRAIYRILRRFSRFGKTFELLHNLYTETHRAYHNLDHIKFLLELFDEFNELIEDKVTVFVTIWFHDAVYYPQKNDNEKQSARLVAVELRKSIVAPEKVLKIVNLILATEKHSAENQDSDKRLFLDFDLAILGSDGSLYGKYAKAIRKEYSFVSVEDYKIGRGKILRDFLGRILFS